MMKRRIGFELITLVNMMKRELDKSIDSEGSKRPETLGLTGGNMQVIHYIYDNQDINICQRDIENYFSLRPSTVSANLRLMEKKGLITRQYSTEDTRIKIVKLTDKAYEIEKQMRHHITIIENKFNDVLTDEERKQLLSLIDKIKLKFNE